MIVVLVSLEKTHCDRDLTFDAPASPLFIQPRTSEGVSSELTHRRTSVLIQFDVQTIERKAEEDLCSIPP